MRVLTSTSTVNNLAKLFIKKSLSKSVFIINRQSVEDIVTYSSKQDRQMQQSDRTQ